ncbi:MAG: 30S ribosomal protein S14 [Puniceicoccales bacterium]|jgi:small subunit ribosomal protein S14|nr:30S ribosomal protein S14 [Puniceicoccales bacterium]
MAKTSVIKRNEKRMILAAKFIEKRKEYKKILRDPSVGDGLFFETLYKLNKLPRNSSSVRIRNRCCVTGRPRAFHRRFGISRLKLREFALAGLIPGLVKASW